ncbi:hypothetical protein SMD44_04568 [Streptomyces alboflavus]|uniref:Uncharacterized protein n=1 Tax=Streptomyces alboflavus TaxID=67267 RepID=A0A1Z1WFI4_9ACTN|nr:hypothetical protein [Streptomyces alboflavus]ARX85110.1 hypothetical protein SMD44_04568 [Streptomyces alboflavus]
MLTDIANGHTRPSLRRPFDRRPSFWPRVREFAVPPAMIETATARRLAGDWAGACAAAGVDVDLSPRSLTRTHGRELAARVRDDLRHLAPDLLRWHLPRIAPDGLLRPGLTIPLARYDTGESPYDTGARGGAGAPHPVHLVVRTPPAWADAGQRVSLALWDGSRAGPGVLGHQDPPSPLSPYPRARPYPHPHPYPSRRFRLDLHRHLWDARRAGELRVRSGADRTPADSLLRADPEPLPTAPDGLGCAVDRWAAEAEFLLRAEGRADGVFAVRLGGGRRVVLRLDGAGGAEVVGGGGGGGGGRSGGRAGGRVGRHGQDRAEDRVGGRGQDRAEDRVGGRGQDRAEDRVGGRGQDRAAPPVLPDAATWVLPDLELLRTGALDADGLHPLVAAALVPDRPPRPPSPTPDRTGDPRAVDCRGARHRIGLVDGVLAALDHDPAEVRREELLVALGGPPLPCLRAIDEAHRRPDCLTGVRERLDHGDTAGALAVVEGLLGPEAVLRAGPLRDELEAAAARRITYGLFRAGLLGAGARGGGGPGARVRPGRARAARVQPRRTTAY